MAIYDSTTILPFSTSNTPTDPNPTAPAAMLALPAPSAATLCAIAKAQRRERFIARERYLRRKRVAALVAGLRIGHRGHFVALPASVGEIVKTGYRERTATIRMQERMIAETGIDDGNPNHAWQVLMDAKVAKLEAQRAAQVIEGEVAA